MAKVHDHAMGGERKKRGKQRKMKMWQGNKSEKRDGVSGREAGRERFGTKGKKNEERVL